MINSALDYHRTTSYIRENMRPHYMDWANTPRTYKIYPELPHVPLQPTGSCARQNIWELLDQASEVINKPDLDLGTLSDVLQLSYTLTAKRRMGSQTMFYRSVPSAGALYPTELYICSHLVKDLEPGVYYYDIYGYSLKQLRSREFNPVMDAGQFESSRDDVAATILLSSIFFRSSWKYRTRAFRYVSLDTGHLLENIVLALNLYALPHVVTYDFDDSRLHHLIGVDGKREACFACIQIFGQTGAQQQEFHQKSPDAIGLDAGILDASCVSGRERADETIKKIYRLGSIVLDKPTTKGNARVTDREFTQSFSLAKPGSPGPIMPYPESVLKRRSIRSYKTNPYPANHLMQLIALLCSPMPTGIQADKSDKSNMAIGFLAANVADVESGFYLLDRALKKYHLVKPGNLNAQMATVCLDQDWLRQAPLHFLFMSNLNQLERHLGSRGYRYDLLNAGRMGQRLYMGATALGDGCCGIGALYDQEAKDLLDLNAGSYLLYLVAVGQPSSGWQ